MSVEFCQAHSMRYDLDFVEMCPVCELEASDPDNYPPRDVDVVAADPGLPAAALELAEQYRQQRDGLASAMRRLLSRVPRGYDGSTQFTAADWNNARAALAKVKDAHPLLIKNDNEALKKLIWSLLDHAHYDGQIATINAHYLDAARAFLDANAEIAKVEG